MESKCRADLPYPEFDINIRDMNEVRLLMPVYGGRDSETTACLNYIYYHYVTEQTQPELSNLLRCIAISEMKHHSMLGEAICHLGGTPYIGGNYNYWQGSYVNYAKAPELIIKNAIISEKQAISDYRKVIAHTKIPAVRDMIERIIADEEVHIELLRNAQNQLY